MLTHIKSESNAPFLKSTPLAHKIIFFEKKSTSSSKMGFSIELLSVTLELHSPTILFVIISGYNVLSDYCHCLLSFLN